MTAHATVALTRHGLELRCPAAGLREDRLLTDEDINRLSHWARCYRIAVQEQMPASLIGLGQEMHHWLNGNERFLDRLQDTVQPPFLIEFAVPREATDRERAFLDAPWELIATDGEPWALRADIIFCPVRRVGKAVQPPGASANRLSVVFMAAAPRGADNLNYEGEEAIILSATKNLGIELVVEESGTLELLSKCVAREHPHVVHISCHGSLEPEPLLLLEDDIGERHKVRTSQLIGELAGHHPRLLFLSACRTAEAHPVLDSLARSLVRSGSPAVIGFAAPLLENEASLFAGSLYKRLGQGEDLTHGFAFARLDLSEALRNSPGGSRDWHLARLYVGICAVGLDFGQLLCAAGKRDEGVKILARSRDGFIKLGRPDHAQHVQGIIDKLSKDQP